MSIVRSSVAALAVLALGAGSANAQTEIQFWHAMGGQLGEATTALIEGFNRSQTEYRVNPIYKGSYTETLTAAIAAFRAKQAPHIVQVFEVGTATMMASGKEVIYPVHQLMADFKQPFSPRDYLQNVTGYYSTSDGRLLSLPFNSSTPVFYWNKAAFQKAGLNPDTPPKTWPEVEQFSRRLLAAGFQCGFTSQWQTWIQVENFGAWHNIPMTTKGNGFNSIDIQLQINDPLRVKHVDTLARWHKEKIFVYAGREGRATPRFISGDCPMLFGSSGSAGQLKQALKDPWGIAMMPYWPDVQGAPQNSIIGGATLWVLKSRPQREYDGVAKLFSYLSRADVQAKWHQDTGYVPITLAAAKLTEDQGFYRANPGFDIGVKQLNNKPPTINSKGLRIGNFVQIRDIMDEELESVWNGQKTAQQALDAAVARGNEQLKNFVRFNR
jgi:sn-glycerol 3-phosphate transport system substrate-binding protein